MLSFSLCSSEHSKGWKPSRYVSRRSFLEMLPCIDYVQRICAPCLFEGPSSRACFIFDDPNLHWPRYGFVDFKEIAANATKHNYHVSFATIPFDGWFTHQPTAEIFRNNADRLSLAVHGNNHTRWELARMCRNPREHPCSTRQFIASNTLNERLNFVFQGRWFRLMVPAPRPCWQTCLPAVLKLRLFLTVHCVRTILAVLGRKPSDTCHPN